MGLATEVGAGVRVAGALPPTLLRLVHPLRPDPSTLARLEPVPAIRARGGVELFALTQNAFTAPNFAVAEGLFVPLRARMTMGAFLVRHEQATFLVDAGVCLDVRTRHLAQLPAVTRVLLGGSPPDTGLAEEVRHAGFDPAELAFVLLTHLHWDHCSGLAELPDVPVRLSRAEYEFGQRDDSSLLSNGIVPDTYRPAGIAPVELDGPPVETFPASLDLFGDGAVIAVSLPGHTPGHVGVLLTLHSGRRVLLAGDAVWSAQQVRYGLQRAPLPGWLVDHDRREAYESVLRLYRMSRDITVLPAHDRRAIDEVFAGGSLR